uniref:Zinc finger domain, LSD1 subclass domain-containing protein n=1 Tax=Neospora caninum (strain Liverpool) TaxID=572307 RepID=A0A0F7U7M6_NEOCL|nr:TPA: zinc finger domain, LSD1 subclass domain-containing protein [Neospora caninum Liverpool]
MADSSEGAADGRAETRPSSGPETEAPVGHRTPSRASAFTALVATLSHTRDSEGDEPASEASSSATPPESILLGSVQADGQSGEAQSDLVPAGSATSQELAVDAGSHEDGASEARGAVLRERTERGPVEGCTNAAGETEGQASRRGRSAATIPANADGESGDSTCRRKFRGERAGPDAYVGNDCFFLELPDGAVSCVAGLENLPASVEAVNGPNPGDAQQGPFLARLQCHNCLQLLEFDSRAQFVQCSSCLTLNAVQSQASNGLRGGRAMIVICGRCSTRNISCLGSLYVECWQCRTVCQVDYPAAGSGLLGPSGAERSRTGETGVSSEGSRLHRRLLSRRSFPRPRFRWLTSRRQGDSEAAAVSRVSADHANETTGPAHSASSPSPQAMRRRRSRRPFSSFSSMGLSRRPFFPSRRRFSVTSLRRGFTHPEQSAGTPAGSGNSRSRNASSPRTANAGRPAPRSRTVGDEGGLQAPTAAAANPGRVAERRRLRRLPASTFSRRGDSPRDVVRTARSFGGRGGTSSREHGAGRYVLDGHISADSPESFLVEPEAFGVRRQAAVDRGDGGSESAHERATVATSSSPHMTRSRRRSAVPTPSAARRRSSTDASSGRPGAVAIDGGQPEAGRQERPRSAQQGDVSARSSDSGECATGGSERHPSRVRAASPPRGQGGPEAERRSERSSTLSGNSGRGGSCHSLGGIPPEREAAAERGGAQRAASSRRGAVRRSFLSSCRPGRLHTPQALVDPASSSPSTVGPCGRPDPPHGSPNLNSDADLENPSTNAGLCPGTAFVANTQSNPLSSTSYASMTHANNAFTRSDNGAFLTASSAPFLAAASEAGSDGGNRDTSFGSSARGTLGGKGRPFRFFSLRARTRRRRDSHEGPFAGFRGNDGFAQGRDLRRPDAIEEPLPAGQEPSSLGAPAQDARWASELGESRPTHAGVSEDRRLTRDLELSRPERGRDPTLGQGAPGDGRGRDQCALATADAHLARHLDADNGVRESTERTRLTERQGRQSRGASQDGREREYGTASQHMSADGPGRLMSGVDGEGVTGNRKNLGRILTAVRWRKTAQG